MTDVECCGFRLPVANDDELFTFVAASVRADWRVARSLEKLLAQLDEQAPNRSRVSDGSIGDPEHQTRESDHNPDAQGVVRARDFTHDPAAGADMEKFTEQLRRSRDRRIKYVIFNGRIFSSTVQPWEWRPYHGDNRHDKHAHVSVVATPVADSTEEWEVSLDMDVNLKQTVWTASEGNWAGVPAGARSLGNILAALDSRTAALYTRLHTQLLEQIAADSGNDITITPEQLEYIGKVFRDHAPRVEIDYGGAQP